MSDGKTTWDSLGSYQWHQVDLYQLHANSTLCLSPQFILRDKADIEYLNGEIQAVIASIDKNYP